VTGMGGFAATASSYRRTINPSSVEHVCERKAGGGARGGFGGDDFVDRERRRLATLSGAISMIFLDYGAQILERRVGVRESVPRAA
jgi:hypothetical protein